MHSLQRSCQLCLPDGASQRRLTVCHSSSTARPEATSQRRSCQLCIPDGASQCHFCHQSLPDGASQQRSCQLRLPDGALASISATAPRPATNLIWRRRSPVWLAIWRTWAGFANSQLLPDAAALSSIQGPPRSGNSSAQTSASLHPSRSASLAGPLPFTRGMGAHGLCGRVPDSAGNACSLNCCCSGIANLSAHLHRLPTPPMYLRRMRLSPGRGVGVGCWIWLLLGQGRSSSKSPRARILVLGTSGAHWPARWPQFELTERVAKS